MQQHHPRNKIGDYVKGLKDCWEPILTFIEQRNQVLQPPVNISSSLTTSTTNNNIITPTLEDCKRNLQSLLKTLELLEEYLKQSNLDKLRLNDRDTSSTELGSIMDSAEIASKQLDSISF
jgi:hypothetical protein